MKYLQSQIIGTQTKFSIKFGDKLNFILFFLSCERLHYYYIYIQCSYPVQLLELVSNLVH
jgi:hypothetical protein